MFSRNDLIDLLEAGSCRGQPLSAGCAAGFATSMVGI
jgi:hypothetical protein